MSNGEDRDNDTVGYKKPPRAHRFVKGRTGNPRGRPRKTVPSGNWLIDLIRDESQRRITIHEGGKPIRMPAGKAALRSMIVCAIKGEPQAQRAFFKMLADVGKAEGRLNPIPSDEELAKLGPVEISYAYKKMMGTA